MSRVTTTRVVLIVCALLALSAPASAQVDLTGSWDTRLHEDWMERCCGRDLGDYTGIALNDEAAPRRSHGMRRSTRCVSASASSSRPGRGSFSRGASASGAKWTPPVKSSRGRSRAHVQRDIVTIWMDGRPHPSDERVSQLFGLHHGPMGRRYADGGHHPHEDRGSAAIQRDAQERPRDRDRPPHEAR